MNAHDQKIKKNITHSNKGRPISIKGGAFQFLKNQLNLSSALMHEHHY